ncbi:aldose epimerase family protein [Virgibacillus soli]|uniref:aldose epimerase family protein n=1 Tax=Paracerasibacillus soli TaxID=480284 RepID=UPI0035EA67FE
MKITSEKVLNKWVETTLTNNNGMQVRFLNFGGIITEIIVPNRDGVLENVVLGYRQYEEYEQNPNYFGAIIGRVAGRIQDASFHLDGKRYELENNEETRHLHGGSGGFHQVMWETSPFQTNNQIGVQLSHTSPDGEGGYPGRVNVTVTYTLTNKNEFFIDYQAISDKKTILTLTNHTYFNLTGQQKETVGNHFVNMNSDQFIELNQNLLPTGKLIDVTHTPFDFRKGKRLIEGLKATHPQNITVGHGYDHYFLFNKDAEPSIIVKEDTSGRILEINTDQPGVVMYTGNGLDNQLQLREGMSKKYLGVCFETQGPPASLHQQGLPSILLEANEPYKKQTRFAFHRY